MTSKIIVVFFPSVRDGLNTVSESTLSSTQLSELSGPRRVPGRELSECFSAYILVCQSELTELLAELSESGRTQRVLSFETVPSQQCFCCLLSMGPL